MRVQRLDHLVLTVVDIDAAVEFYEGVLGMRRVDFGDDRVAVAFGDQKINLHQAGHELTPKAAKATVGSGDLCFLVDGPIEDVASELASRGVPVEVGPVDRTGAVGPLRSVYVRDPDGNLVELAEPAG